MAAFRHGQKPGPGASAIRRAAGSVASPGLPSLAAALALPGARMIRRVPHRPAFAMASDRVRVVRRHERVRGRPLEQPAPAPPGRRGRGHRVKRQERQGQQEEGGGGGGGRCLALIQPPPQGQAAEQHLRASSDRLPGGERDEGPAQARGHMWMRPLRPLLLPRSFHPIRPRSAAAVLRRKRPSLKFPHGEFRIRFFVLSSLEKRSRSLEIGA